MASCASGQDILQQWLAEQRVDLVAYVRELLHIATDNPPGDCAPPVAGEKPSLAGYY